VARVDVVTDAFTSWLALLPPRTAGELIVPATADLAILQAISAADYVPVLVDVRPGLYVAEAERACPAMCERTVGVVLPWTYGNQPDTRYVTPACAIHECAWFSQPPPSRIVGIDLKCLVGDLARAVRRIGEANDPEVALESFWHLLAVADEVTATRNYRAAYDTLAEHPVGMRMLPQKLEDSDPWWQCLPLLAPDTATRDRLVAAIPGAEPMRGAPTEDELATLGTYMVCGQLEGARMIGARGVTVPLVDGIGDMVVGVLG
jgi:dTDP-4-amino-4,6-dideoxygalactose transaminase